MKIVYSFFRTGLTLNCRNALALNFILLPHAYIIVALDIELCVHESAHFGSLTVYYGQFEFEPDQPLVPSLVTRYKYWPDHILCRLVFNFNGAARLWQYPAYHWSYLTHPTSLFYRELFMQSRPSAASFILRGYPYSK